jgi:hypothetical protein
MSEQRTDEPDRLAQHEQESISAYLQVRPFYESLSDVVGRIIEEALKNRNIKVACTRFVGCGTDN